MCRSSPAKCRSRTPSPSRFKKCLRSSVPSSSSGSSRRPPLCGATAISSRHDQPRSTGPRRPSSRRGPFTAKPSTSKPLSLPGMAMKGPKCGSLASSRVSGLASASPARSIAQRPSAALRASCGTPWASCSIGRQASKRRLPSSASLASRLALSACSRPALAFLRFRPWEPTTQSQPSATAMPSRSASSSAAPGRVSRSASAKSCTSPKRRASLPSGGRRRSRAMPQASSPATHSQSPVKAAPDKLVLTSEAGANSRRTALGMRAWGMGGLRQGRAGQYRRPGRQRGGAG